MTITFFIVDDEPGLHMLYRHILEIKGYKVIGDAYNGNECIKKLILSEKNQTEEPDFIIMDYRMPVKNGIDTTIELLKVKPGLKIIFVSADHSIREEALKAGAVSFIKKPFNMNDFFRTLEKVSHK